MTPRALRVLVIDDEYSFAEFARLLLADAGFQAVAALEAGEGLRLAAADPPDAILLDLHLRDLSAAAALRSIRAQPATKSIPVIATSISASRSEVEAALAAGAACFLPKPLDREKLLETLRGVLP